MSHRTEQRTGPQVLSFFSDIDDTEQPYGLYIPANYDPQRAYPLVMMLHGGGSNHRLALRRVFGKGNLPHEESDAEATRYFPDWPDVEYIVATPLARGTMGYRGIAEKDVMDVLADVKGKFLIDEDRIYLTGYSMGGMGTILIGLSQPDIWAAIAPVCSGNPTVLSSHLLQNALNLPVHLFQGEIDPVIPATGTRELRDSLKELGTVVEYTEYPDVAHNAWDYAYSDGAIFQWFSQFVRNHVPDRVRFSSDRYKYAHAYWVHMDELESGKPAMIDASFTGKNKMKIATIDVNAFSLHLEDHPSFEENQDLEVVIDGMEIQVSTTGILSFSKENGAWQSIPYTSRQDKKRIGTEGPMSEAIATRHVYVYGTEGSPSEEELIDRQENVIQAAQSWTMYRTTRFRFENGSYVMIQSPLHFFPRIVGDFEVRQSDRDSCNLVLFGTKETNRMIDQLADILPLHLDPSAATAGYGLLYIYPWNGHYVLISSGMPWRPEVRQIFDSKIATISLRRDFVLWSNSQNNIIVEGDFDQFWKVPPEYEEALKANGVVVIS